MTGIRRQLAAVLPFVLAGCGSGPAPGPVPVSGTVTLNDRPLANATVTFIPVPGTPGFGGTGKTNADGKYTLADSRENTPGVLPGKYRVVVGKRLMPDGSEVPADDTTPPIMSPAKESLPAYGNPTAPALSAAVPDGGGTIDFSLKDAKKK
ncbi:MAG: hypothetical protein JWO38_3818 [Gemmataceae bacterium]|nr:hypothetical protein [Gemmataceae bacterium]